MLTTSTTTPTGSAWQQKCLINNAHLNIVICRSSVLSACSTRRIGRRYAATLAILVAVAAIGWWRDSLYASSVPGTLRTALRSAVAVLTHRAARTRPAQHIYFLKTHKCASTTVQRVVLTYAIRNNLSVALPTESINNFYPQIFSAAQAKRTCAHPSFDIMAAHAIFSESARREMHSDTVYVAIVRDPADQMESAYYYYLLGMCNSRLKLRSLSFEQYLVVATHRHGGDSDDAPKPPRSRYPCDIRQLRFLQLHDFGFDLSSPPTPHKVQAAIKRLDALFDIVLIVERLDESLVLLRDLLGWSTADIVHLRSNFRVNSTARKAAAAMATPPLRMSNATRQAAYAWNWGDKMLYDHFRTKMDAAIAQNAAYVHEQVSDFRRQLEAFHDGCVAGIAARQSRRSATDTSYVVDGGSEVAEVAVKASKRGRWHMSASTERYLPSEGRNASYICKLATMSEVELFHHLNMLQPDCFT